MNKCYLFGLSGTSHIHFTSRKLEKWMDRNSLEQKQSREWNWLFSKYVFLCNKEDGNIASNSWELSKHGSQWSHNLYGMCHTYFQKINVLENRFSTNLNLKWQRQQLFFLPYIRKISSGTTDERLKNIILI